MKSTATANWQGNLFEGGGETSLGSGAAGPLPVNWESRTEAAKGKTNPEELIASAHAACFSMAFSNELAKAGFLAANIETSAVATAGKTDAGWRLLSMALSVRASVPDIGGEQFQEIAELAKNGCPVSNALAGNVDISLDATLV